MAKIGLLSQRQIFISYLGFFIVYLSGLFIPLMQNDSAQHASMAMRMALENDFFSIFKGENPYLDKPHLHFWLAAWSMKLLGIHPFAYRIPALLCLLLGAISTKKLAELLYDKEAYIGHTAALIFLSSQTIILSAHDVRTDAVLTGFVIFAIWQLVKWIKTQNISAAVFAGLGAAMAFSSKGLIALVIIGFCILAYLLYSREWQRFFNLKLIICGLCFVVGILPILYAYHHQFGEEGIRFILLGQSVARMTGDGFESTNSDYFFFFHTLLWVFLPFSLAFYFGVFERTRYFIQHRFQRKSGVEFLTLGGFWLVLLVFSFSKFKLPHYLNGLIAVLSIFTASYLLDLLKSHQNKTFKILWWVQVVLVVAGLLAAGLLTYYFTGFYNIVFFIAFAIGAVVLLLQIIKAKSIPHQYVYTGLLFAVVINLFLNTQFYPVLTQYQGSLKLAEYVNTKGLDKNKIYMLEGDESWAFDFYTQRNTPRVLEKDLKKGDILLIHKEAYEKFQLPNHIIKTENSFRITRLSLNFLNPNTRQEQLNTMLLVQID